MSEASNQTTILLVLGGLFLVGLASDLIGRRTFLPRVTLLLLAGVAIGPTGFSLLPQGFLESWFPPLTSISLALIGFLLGQKISVSELRQRGKAVVTISLCKAIGAWLIVAFALFSFGADPAIALLLAGIATATAPTATYDIVHESGVRGKFADTLLSVVALDDVWGLLIFTLMMASVGALNGDATFVSGFAGSVIEIGGSITLGAALGIPMAYLTGRINRGEPTLAEAMGFVLLAAGAAEMFNLSPILSTMAMGSTVASLARHHDRPFHAIEGIEWPFMILVIVLAGASLELDAVPLVSGLTAVYIIARCAGTYAGTRIGTHLANEGLQMRRWLGLALFPQAGVALGMALLASQRYPDTGAIVLPVVLASTIIFEIATPVITRQALQASRVAD